MFEKTSVFHDKLREIHCTLSLIKKTYSRVAGCPPHAVRRAIRGPRRRRPQRDGLPQVVVLQRRAHGGPDRQEAAVPGGGGGATGARGRDPIPPGIIFRLL